ncbi:helix-turn-helix transcriptional regulator [Parapedobacter soli]|uniref:helix-turn-helix transcriptional regulator n=1 Tax=Parapedobacter soli TaxID=416955 RepID=UPI0021C62533|nr:helix-turn-helix transcriptional regulator [Parapedobacter soli]
MEFTFLEFGNLYFSTKKEQFNLEPGSLTITRPWQPHKVGNPNVTIGKLHWLIIDVGVTQPHQSWDWPDWIILSKEDIDCLTKMLRQNDVQVWNSDRKLRECFMEIGKCLNDVEQEIPQSKLNILINNLLLEILCLFKRGHVELDESLIEHLRTVRLFLDYLQTSFDKYWSLESMAEYCGLGKTSLSKYCRQLTNMSPINYLIKVRLEAAAELLSKQDIVNVTKVCYDCGFSSFQYFATVFKTYFRCTPTGYMNISSGKELIGGAV